ncbi:GNAT family N-acetyltransferase [Xanthobacter sp. V4C-4]|uniref:GNAT family N-acetyltransferase n=1 Tax=Xanthobacter cornucopiae TaxID=3119924 RepID=UPI00372745DE
MPEPTFLLRSATAIDRPAMADLWVDSWVRTLPEIDFEARRAWLAGHLDTLAAAGTLIRVAEAEGIVAGFVAIHPGTGYLDQIAVAPAFWGRGAAEALMAEARRLSPARVALDVNQENPRAVRFYVKMGLVITGEGENPMSGRRTFHMEWRPAG